MEPVFKQTGTSKGLEVLYFEDAEIQKRKHGQVSFAASGPLSVLYFKDYHRFFLRLDDWVYPLMKRLPVTGMNKTDATSSRVYCLPGHNGFCYNLRVNCFGSREALENFESLLQECSKFSWKNEAHHGHLDQSPDDKLTRHLKQEPGLKEVVTERLKQGIETLKNKIETVKVGTKNIDSRKKMIDIKTIKNKDYKKDAKSSLDKNFFQHGKKVSEEFLNLRRSNTNMILSRSYNELIGTNDSQVPSLYLPIVELEETILDYRDLAKQENFGLTNWFEQKPSFTQSIRDGLQKITDLVLPSAETSNGLEILYFEKAELRKTKFAEVSFVASGPLSVLHVKDYHRFFLRINDWIYPLMRRLPIVGMDKTDGTSSRTYCLPGPDGSCYNLRVDCFGSGEAFENFEAILQECSKFCWKGESHHGHLAKSPDDKLVGRLRHENGVKEMITEGFKHSVQSLKTKIESISQPDEKLSKEFGNLRHSNVNMILPRSYHELIETSEAQVPSLNLPTLELEKTILECRDIASKRNFNLTNWFEQKLNFSQEIETLFERSRDVGFNPNLDQANLG